MAIKGSLAEAALPNVIQLLTISLKSGCLSVTDGKNFGNIFIKDGKILHATILNQPQRLGDILVLKKIIDENGNAKVLFLTATPINTSLDDLLNLIKLFYRKGSNLSFDKLIRELSDIINLFQKR